MNFAQLFSTVPQLLLATQGMGWQEPTPVQIAAIPSLLEGRDLLGFAPTGTGKTGAFGLPLLGRLDSRITGVQALVVLPTRELANQVAVVLATLANLMWPDPFAPAVACVFGGRSGYMVHVNGTETVAGGTVKESIVVGTPGRLADLVEKSMLNLTRLRILVLDEVDQILNQGFRPAMDVIIAASNPQKQTVIFSATANEVVWELAESFHPGAEQVDLRPEVNFSAGHRHILASQASFGASEFTLHVVLEACRREVGSAVRVIVFCNTISRARTVSHRLVGQGINCIAIHGDMTVSERQVSLAAFRSGQVFVLVATDVAARGLDVSDVTHVVNLDPPRIEAYVHRAGRTARAGKGGMVINLVDKNAVNHTYSWNRLEQMFGPWFDWEVGKLTQAEFSRKRAPLSVPATNVFVRIDDLHYSCPWCKVVVNLKRKDLPTTPGRFNIQCKNGHTGWGLHAP